MPVTINPGLKTTVALYKLGVYTLDCVGSQPALQVKAVQVPGTDRVKLTVEFEIVNSMIIKTPVEVSDTDWLNQKNKTCYWDFLQGNPSEINSFTKPVIQVVPADGSNGTVLDVSIGFTVAKGKIGGGAGKVGGGAGGLGLLPAGEFWLVG